MNDTTNEVQAVASEAIGKTLREADALISAAGFVSNVAFNHGKAIPGILNFRGGRIQLHVRDDIVFDAKVG